MNREWTCKNCGTHHDRDKNATRNLRDEGKGILDRCASGDSSLILAPSGVLSVKKLHPQVHSDVGQGGGKSPGNWHKLTKRGLLPYNRIIMNEKRTAFSISILSSDFSSPLDSLAEIEAGGAGWLHLDVMDGSFVPQLTFGPKFVKDLRPHSGLVFDAHLMIDSPERQIDAFLDAGCDIITLHQESCIHLDRALNRIKDGGAKAGIAINPSTPVCLIGPILPLVDLVLVMTVNPGFGGQRLIQGCLSKVVELAELREEEGYDYLISVDGGVNLDTVQDVAAAGVDVAVVGSAFFNEADKSWFLERMTALAQESHK